MKYGISETDLRAILSVFITTTDVEEVILFGSRAKGNFEPGSDIDLTVKGPNLTHTSFLDLLIALEELDFLYKVDLIRFESINNAALLDHIKRIGITLFQRSKKGTKGRETYSNN